MRYVILIVSVAFFVIWDGLYNNGSYLDFFIGELIRLMRMAGLY